MKNKQQDIPEPPEPPPCRSISEDVKHDTFELVMIILFVMIVSLLAGVFTGISINVKKNNPIKCIDGWQYRVNKVTGNKVEIIIKNGLPVKCELYDEKF